MNNPEEMIESLKRHFIGKVYPIEKIEKTVTLMGIPTPVVTYLLPDLPKIRDELRALARTDRIRVIIPGSIITKDIQFNRVNLYIDEKGEVVNLNLG